jgi:hypothetical protein
MPCTKQGSSLELKVLFVTSEPITKDAKNYPPVTFSRNYRAFARIWACVELMGKECT